MALDDHEQKILAEIERQFYEEDPELARAVRRISRPPRFGVRFAAVGAIVGLAVVVAFFATNTLVAFVGFALLVVSSSALATVVKARGWLFSPRGRRGEKPEADWRDPFRRS